MAFNKDNKIKSNFSKITIGIASPEEILEKSFGEVLKPETINYRTYKPERDGLFCEKIFGPVKDYECHCGKYKRIRYKGIVCDRCGVEVTEKKVRRERSGHISLVVPVAHIWYFRSLPNKIGYLLGLPSKKLDAVIYYERYIVIQPGAASEVEGCEDLARLDLLTEDEYLDIVDKLPRENQYLEDSDPNKFVCKMGAEAIYELLQNLDLDTLSYELRHRADTDTSQQRKTEALKRLQVVESFRASKNKNRPEWMVLKVIPVIPPDLRPLVPLDGGRFATSDLNDLYRRVIIRNNRLKRLIEIKAPEVILRNEKRMLQEAVDSLLDNSRKSSVVKTDSNRPLKSLSDSLKGKQGRFRQNLLGKRVDYSARSVIVVGPELKMHECGLPKNMAAELYKPFVIRKLIERGIVKTVKSAKKIVDRKEPIVWDILEYVMKGHPVLLNRAPTLHRLGIQAFQPRMIEGKAIQLHPLACTAFNADFDGDQMAVHLPLGNEAVLEAQMLMLGAHNILNPANGAPITVPSQDMVLGLYYITKLRKEDKGEGLVFYGPEEAQIAYNEGKCSLHAIVSVIVDDLDENGKLVKKMVKETSVGRVLFNQYVPKEIGYVNTLISKKSLRDIISTVIKKCGVIRSAQFLDDIKNLGYQMAFRGGLSFNLGDVLIPEEKEVYVKEGYEQVEEVMNNYNMGFITNNERYNQIIDIWTNVNTRLTKTLMDKISTENQGFNPIYMMLDSGARGSKDQIRQLAGMRGLMADTSGNTIELPIKSNFREGLDVLEYFISAHGARKGLSDTALRTADSGYLTRRLVDVSQDLVIREMDCSEGKTIPGMYVSAFVNDRATADSDAKADVLESLEERITGRFLAEDIKDPATGEVIVKANHIVTPKRASQIVKTGVEKVKIRTILTCRSHIGVCAKCYGSNMATGQTVQVGEAVGIIAAQSIGEPGTQLTMRTFHTGGVAGDNITQGLPRVEELFEARKPKTLAVLAEFGGVVSFARTEKKTDIVITDDEGNSKAYPVSRDTRVKVQEGQIVAKGEEITEGSENPHDIVRILGVRAVQDYMIREVQKVYRIQGVEINDKHIELIVRQMLKKIVVDDAGDSNFLPGSSVDTIDFAEVNEQLEAEGKKTATGTPIILGITKASLATNSFMSAASFQETAKVLTDAAINGKVDPLIGLKENVIIGKLIPAGTGMKRYQNVEIDTGIEYVEEPEEDDIAEKAEAADEANEAIQTEDDVLVGATETEDME